MSMMNDIREMRERLREEQTEVREVQNEFDDEMARVLQERVNELQKEQEEQKETLNLIDKIHTLNIKKGDVLVLRPNMERFQLPPKVLKNMLRNIKKDIHLVVDIPILIIPDHIGIDIIRLEEWYV